MGLGSGRTVTVKTAPGALLERTSPPDGARGGKLERLSESGLSTSTLATSSPSGRRPSSAAGGEDTFVRAGCATGVPIGW